MRLPTRAQVANFADLLSGGGTHTTEWRIRERLEAENEALRAALRRCIETSAECRRWLTTDGAPPPTYRTYRQVWDASRDAEIQALKLLGGQVDEAD